MKKCTICKELKPLTDYNKNKSKKDGLNNLCKDCSRLRSRKYYKDNGEQHRVTVTENRNKLRKINRINLLKLLKKSKCVDCANSDSRTFEFDHVRGKKERNISRMQASGHSWENILKEIEKCDIVCANCHRIRTFSRSKTYRNN